MNKATQTYRGNSKRVNQDNVADRLLFASTLLFILGAATDIQMITNLSILTALTYLVKK